MDCVAIVGACVHQEEREATLRTHAEQTERARRTIERLQVRSWRTSCARVSVSPIRLRYPVVGTC